MKKILFTTVLLLSFVFRLNAQVRIKMQRQGDGNRYLDQGVIYNSLNANEVNGNQAVVMEHSNIFYGERNERVEKLINDAKNYFNKELYNQAIEVFQKAFDLSPNSFTCIDYYYLGYSFHCIKDYLSAIENLRIASECLEDYTVLSLILSKLSDSHMKILNYNRATFYAKKQLTFAKNDFWISDAYFNLGFLHSIQAKYTESIPYYNKCIDAFLKYLSITERDIMKGTVRDDIIGEYYYEMGYSYAMLDMDKESSDCIIKSALCGYEQGIDYCRRVDIDYINRVVDKRENSNLVSYKDISFQCPINWEVDKQTIQDGMMYFITCGEKEVDKNSIVSILCINTEIPPKEILLDTNERTKNIKRFKAVKYSGVKIISFNKIHSVATEVYGIEDNEEIYGTSFSFNLKGKTVVILVASNTKVNHDYIYDLIESSFHIK